MKFYRKLLIPSALIFLFSIFTACGTKSSAERFIPQDVQGYGEIHLGKILNEKLTKEVLAKIEEATGKDPLESVNESISRIQNEVGDIENVTFFFANLQGKAFGMDGDFGIIYTVKKLDVEKFTASLETAGEDAKKTYQEKFTYYNDRDLGFLYFKKNTLFLSNKEEVLLQIFDVMGGAPGFDKNKELQGLVKKVKGNDIFFASLSSESLREMSPQLAEAKSIVIGLSVNSGVNALISCDLGNEENAAATEKQLNEMLSMENPLMSTILMAYKDLIAQINVKKDNTTVTVSGKFTGEQVKTLTNTLTGMIQ